MKKNSSIFLVFLLGIVIILFTTFSFGFKKKSMIQPPKFVLEVVLDTTSFSIDSDSIDFKLNQTLYWSDFKGMPPIKVNGNEVANSSLGFGFRSSITTENKLTKATITINSFFIKTKSWVLPKNKNDYILNHEYNHFIIARIGAEMFRNNLWKAKLTKENISTELSRIFKSTWSDYRLLQNKYDKETNHSINKMKQNAWDEYLEKKKLRFF